MAITYVDPHGDLNPEGNGHTIRPGCAHRSKDRYRNPQGVASVQALTIGLVDDQQAMRTAFRAAALSSPMFGTTPSIYTAATTGVLLESAPRIDVVALDLSLNDGSTPGTNVASLIARGSIVVIYTIGDSSRLIREAVAAGAVAIAMKSDPLADTLAIIRRVAEGLTVDSAELAAAIDSDNHFVHHRLAPLEQEVLRLRAAGLSSIQVSRRTGIPDAESAAMLERIRLNFVRFSVRPR